MVSRGPLQPWPFCDSDMKCVAAAWGAALESRGVCVCGETKKKVKNNSIIGLLAGREAVIILVTLC